MQFLIFPKFFAQQTLDQLADGLAGVPLDGLALPIRKGLCVDPDRVAEQLPAAVKTLQARSLPCPMVWSDYTAEDLVRVDAPMRVMADAGVRILRIAGGTRRRMPDPRQAVDQMRREVHALEPIARRHKLRIAIQVHGGACPHNATVGWQIVHDLDPAIVGIMMDPGNNLIQEGTEQFDYQTDLLRDHLIALGAKDGQWVRTRPKTPADPGFDRQWVPCDEGQINWTAVFQALARVNFAGPVVLMPFYHTTDQEKMTSALTRELEWLRRAEADEPVKQSLC